MDAGMLNATLLDRHDLTERLAIFRVRPKSSLLPPFLPGQFFRLGLPRNAAPCNTRGTPDHTGRPRITRRAYSVASPPHVREWAEFLVVLVEDGKLTPQLWHVMPGQSLWMDRQASGTFTLELTPPDRDLVMVATGTGIAPFMSMLRTYAGQQRWRRFVLIHGVRQVAELAYRAEIEAITRQDASVVYVPVTSREEPPPCGVRGRVQAALDPDRYEKLTGASLDPTCCEAFLCGNPRMIDDVGRLLATRGFTLDRPGRRGNAHFERYW